VIRRDVRITAKDLLQVPSGGVTYSCLVHNIRVTVLFIYFWFKDAGNFWYCGVVEDSATAETSRSQLWQWIRHQVMYDKDITCNILKFYDE
jgi:malate synthase